MFLLRVRALRFLDDSEKAVLFVTDARGEIKPIVDLEKVPQAFEVQRRPVLFS